MLEIICLKIAGSKSEDPRRQIVVIAKAAKNRVGRGPRRAREFVIGRVDGVGVQRDLVMAGRSHGIKSEIEILSLAVAAGQGEPQIQPASPIPVQRGMERSLISRLLAFRANQGGGSLRHTHSALRRRDHEIGILRRHRARNQLLIRGGYEQLFIRGKILNRRPANTQVTGVLGLEQQRLAVGLNDSSCDLVPILQRNLLSVGRERAEQQSAKREAQTLHVISLPGF